MKKNTINKTIGLFIALFTMIAIFVMFAPAFDSSSYSSVTGNVFQAMFGMMYDTYPVVWPLVLGFVALCLAFIISFGALALDGKRVKLLYLIELVLLIGAGVIFLFSVKFYDAAHAPETLASLSEDGLGAGTICVVVFSFISAAISAGGLLANKKEA